MSVKTVQGNRDTDSLGIIAPHEHILVDIRNQFTEFPDAVRRELAYQKVGIHNLDALSRDPYAVKDNLVLEDISLAERDNE
jgi:predicted metal-dependent phosphotriesterase family hydrolase